MTTTQIILDEKLVSAINALEIYAKCFDDLGDVEKAASLRATITELKVIAYDGAMRIQVYESVPELDEE